MPGEHLKSKLAAQSTAVRQINIDYQYQRRESNISDFDYTENRMTLGLTIPIS